MRRGDVLLSQAIEQKDETALRRILNCDEVGDGRIPMLYLPAFYDGSTRNIDVSPLGYAAHCGWTAGVQILATSGWRVDYMSSRFREYKDLMPEALTLATERNDVETVAALVELGAPPDKKLIYAACRLNLAQVLKVRTVHSNPYFLCKPSPSLHILAHSRHAHACTELLELVHSSSDAYGAAIYWSSLCAIPDWTKREPGFWSSDAYGAAIYRSSLCAIPDWTKRKPGSW